METTQIILLTVALAVACIIQDVLGTIPALIIFGAIWFGSSYFIGA